MCPFDLAIVFTPGLDLNVSSERRREAMSSHTTLVNNEKFQPKLNTREDPTLGQLWRLTTVRLQNCRR